MWSQIGPKVQRLVRASLERRCLLANPPDPAVDGFGQRCCAPQMITAS